MSRKKSGKKAREEFIRHVRGLALYWSEQPNLSPLDRTEGVAHSILVALDGDALACGPYALRPLNQKGNEGPDIAGDLHHELFTPTAAEASR